MKNTRFQGLTPFTFTLAHPAKVWDGVLIPYHANVTLFFNTSGHVAGAQGSSHQDAAEVFQYLVRLGFTSNPESETIVVP